MKANGLGVKSSHIQLYPEVYTVLVVICLIGTVLNIHSIAHLVLEDIS